MALVITKETPGGLFPLTELLYCTISCHDRDSMVASLKTKGTRQADADDLNGGLCANCRRRLG